MPATGRPDAPRGTSLFVEGVGVSARQSDGARLPILDISRLVLAPGARVAITGPSGAGKSSLLGVLAGIVKPDAGRVVWGEVNISDLPEGKRDRWRRGSVGLVFQEFHLVPELDVMANICLPATFDHARTSRAVRERAAWLAETVGLSDPRRRAGLLSRGEQQRTALARALLQSPAILLADEPTASLDEANGRAVADLLIGTTERSDATLVVATHDPALIDRLGTRWRMTAGRVDATENR